MLHTTHMSVRAQTIPAYDCNTCSDVFFTSFHVGSARRPSAHLIGLSLDVARCDDLKSHTHTHRWKSLIKAHTFIYRRVTVRSFSANLGFDSRISNLHARAPPKPHDEECADFDALKRKPTRRSILHRVASSPSSKDEIAFL